MSGAFQNIESRTVGALQEDERPTAVSHVEEGVLGLDQRGVVRYCSPGAEAIFRMPAGALAGRALNELIPRLRLNARAPGLNRVLALSWSGARGWLRVEGYSPARGEFQLDISLTSVAIDSSHVLLASLREADGAGARIDPVQLAVRGVAESDDAVMLTDLDGVIEYVNPGFERLTGFNSEDAVRRTPRILSSGSHPSSFFDSLWGELRSGREFRGTFVNRRKDGSFFHQETSIRPLFNDHGVATHFLSIGHDVSDRVAELARLEQLAHHDELTGLANRSLFKDRLRQAIAHAARRGGSFVLLFLDVNSLKAINDRFGHACGDAALQELARRLQHCLREEDTVARIGGDEFAIILSVAGRREAEAPLQKIGDVLGDAVSFGAQRAHLGASVGACLYPEDGLDEAQLMAGADVAMYAAKARAVRGFACAWADREHS